MILREYHEAIEYDLLTLHRIDLLDFYRGALSPRRLLVLIKNLPRTSAYMQAAHPHVAAWGEHEYLTARHIDVSAAAAGMSYRVPRPGEKEGEHKRRENRAAVFDRRTAQRAKRRGEGTNG